VVICGDHGHARRFLGDDPASFGDASEWAHFGSATVTLIVHAPGLAGERVDVTGGQVDIMPALCYLLAWMEDVASTVRWVGTL
jgi:lipoteichoic acid synthase